MRRLGAVEALNLDGGGSTTFVKKGKVVNRPSNSGRHERRVAVAVAIVPAA
jgi:exopolysaccharide biosynthesis protein